jgi:cytochrome c oxidase subunit 1
MSTATAPAPTPTVGGTSNSQFTTSRVGPKGNILVSWITTTDHKKIGYLYLITSFLYFLLGGVMALVIRAQLFEPGLQIVATKEQYNQLFTMHGTIMLLMFATPLFAGFANVLMPLQIGAPDVASQRLRLLALQLRFAHRRRRVPHPPGCGVIRMVRLCAAIDHDLLAVARR